MNDSERIDLLLKIDGAQSERIDDLVARVEALEAKAGEPAPVKVGTWSDPLGWNCNCDLPHYIAVKRCDVCGYKRPAAPKPEPVKYGRRVDETYTWMCDCEDDVSWLWAARKCNECGCLRPFIDGPEPVFVGEWQNDNTWKCGCYGFYDSAKDCCPDCEYNRPSKPEPEPVKYGAWGERTIIIDCWLCDCDGMFANHNADDDRACKDCSYHRPPMPEAQA